ncbi:MULTISPECIES: PIN domain-containing protein [Ramlibacter]|nr:MULTISPECIES: PIN domain-containing protein [Ramlibacter]MBA2960710.1 DUF4935 domain-containing protein [Ramlibacter sp. CGMCC 1.13660]
MHVFVDTNIFHNHWYLDAAPWRYLFHYLNNEGHALLISRVVIEEVQNLRERRLPSAYKALEQAAAEWTRLTRQQIELPASQEHGNYDLASLLSGRVDRLKILEYEGLSHRTIVSRAMAQKRPFREKEKGYRDTLIWMSLVEYLKLNKVDRKIAFITENVSDFFGADGKRLHEDLVEDLTAHELEDLVEPYPRMSTFVKANINRNEHVLDYGRTMSEFHRYVEAAVKDLIEGGDARFVRALERHLFPGSNVLAHVSPISVRIREGVEDFDLDSTSDLENGEVFVACTFDLRRVDLEMDIPVSDYYANSSAIQEKGELYGVNVDHVVATLQALVRPVFSVTFTYNQKLEECAGFTVDRLGFRARGLSLASSLNEE